MPLIEVIFRSDQLRGVPNYKTEVKEIYLVTGYACKLNYKSLDSLRKLNYKTAQ